ncbi:MAG TPA: tRNA (adenosine(37)-N6)-threonylcarbamoyltransferase complex dimerization subunit type 1 TsaB [Thermoanaerobaculia bacterium]|nr:tRNA (adenosine(37)-N6)-threonylcarbamoyltransferase complex dimerization subunit type 1 TsaB [Thermoanaerobaculia bacterium]
MVLALDTSSSTFSVAAAHGGRLLASAHLPQRQAGAQLLPMLEEVLARAALKPSQLAGLVALRGPGSFTGLRIGLAAALGIHQASGIPATALSTLEVLAAAAPPGQEVASLVRGARGEWLVQRFASGPPPRPRSQPQRLTQQAVLGLAIQLAVAADGLEVLRGAAFATLDPGPLAAVAAAYASRFPPAWNPDLLTRPLYLAPPPATPPGAPKRVLPDGPPS